VPGRFQLLSPGIAASGPPLFADPKHAILIRLLPRLLPLYLISPLPATAFNHHNKREPHISSNQTFIKMSRGNQRDTDRAKAQAKLAGSVSLHLTPHRLHGLSRPHTDNLCRRARTLYVLDDSWSLGTCTNGDAISNPAHSLRRPRKSRLLSCALSNRLVRFLS
jgi:hypothetical protein